MEYTQYKKLANVTLGKQKADLVLKNLKLPEDEEKKGNEEVQDLINEYNKIVENKLKEKENELMSI